MVPADLIEHAGRILADAAASPATALVFGSHARGDASDASDLDFLVIERDVANRAEEMVRLRDALPVLGVPVDVIVVSQEHADKWARVKGTPGGPRSTRAASLRSPESLDLARLFLRKAGEDLDAARILTGAQRAADTVVGFHAQQAIEKFTKAVLAAEEIEIPRTDDVRATLWLSPWSVEFRYGDEITSREMSL